MQALQRTARANGVELQVLKAVEDANDRQKMVLVDRVVERFGEDLSGHCFAIWGLAFKPNTDDMRDAPSLDIIPALQAMGARVQAFDPEGAHEARQLLRDVDFKDNPYDVAADADVLVIITEWDQFRALDLDRALSGSIPDTYTRMLTEGGGGGGGVGGARFA